jgi:hypothetical protein
MLNDEQSREYNRAQKLNTFFGQNQPLIATYLPFNSEYKDFTSNINTLNGFIPNKGIPTAGITQDKLTLRETIANELDQICKSTRSYAIKQGNATLAAETNLSSRKISRLKDADVLPLAQQIQTLITPLLADIAFTPYGITAAMLAQAVADAGTFNGSIGSAGVAGSGSTVANKNIDATIKLLHGNMEQFDLLIGFFKTTDPDFVSGYHLNSAVDNTGIRHSGIRGLVTDNATGNPIAGAVITIVNTTKSATTDLLGHYNISRVTDGEYNVSVSATGAATKTFLQHIRRGSIEEVDVKL